jgi:hypothetical protein
VNKVFKEAFTFKYRIKKISTPQFSGKPECKYVLQYRLPWLWWVAHTYDADEEKMRRRMREYMFDAEQKNTVTYFYNADAIPEYIPEEQKDKFLSAKEKKVRYEL